MIDAVTGDGNNPIILSGKWLIHVRKKDADDIWQSLTEDVESGKIPCLAKISTSRKNIYLRNVLESDHVICVYTPNFLWRDNVRDVRLVLKKSGYEDKLYYKPDILSILETKLTKGTFFPRNILSKLRRYGVTDVKINYRYFG